MAKMLMETEKVLVPDSLQETLWRLEETRQGFRTETDANIREALRWVLARQGLKNSYRHLFAPTDRDLAQGLQLPTGERYHLRKALTRHVLGEEAIRIVIVWELKSSPSVTEALKGFDSILERGGNSGRYCCYTCTVSFLRTLREVKPEKWEEVLERGLSHIRKARAPDGKWHGYPFYYTLLALSEIDTSSARAELRHASKTAEKLMRRYRADDRISRFRRLGLEAAVNAV